MATIFTFGKANAQSDAAIIGAPMVNPRRDWNNQELSDLYRAIASLSQAGMLVEMDRGLTDEGDPWLVLCRLDGEVFIHLCRLDGRYLLDSPALAAPLSGYNFADLIDLFIAQAALAAAPNVVAFRASKVFLHPAALITILVWSLYVWSSDTTQAAQAGDLDLHFGPPDAPLLDTPADGASQPVAQTKAPALIDGLPVERLLSRLQQAVDHAASLPVANNLAAMQMLAVVGTLVLSAVGSTALNTDGDAASLPSHDALLPSLAPEHEASFIDFTDAPAQSVWDNAPSAAPLLTAATPEVPAASAEPTTVSAADPKVLHVAEAHIGNISAVHSEATPVAPEQRQATPVAPPVAPATDLHKPIVELHSATLINDFSNLLNTGLTLSRYDIGGVSLVASFDPASLGALQILGETNKAGIVEMQFEAPQLGGAAEAVLDGSYNEAARAFIDAFLDQADHIQVIASATQLVLIDLTAFDEVSDRAYAYSWTLEDGGTISTLGHIDIFANYHLA